MTMSAPRARRRPVLTLGLAAAATLVALGAGEVVVRLARPAYLLGPDPVSNPFWRYDPELGWAHRPGQQGEFSRAEFSHPVSINAAGWRDRERTIARVTGTARIAVLGDSFAWGHGVADELIFTRRLEPMLNGVEVLNFGLSGSATDQQLLILKHHALAYKPDLILVMLTRNDFTGNTSVTEGTYPKPMFVLDPGGALRLTNVPVPRVSAPARAAQWLRRRSALYHFTASSLEGSDVRVPSAVQFEVTCALLEAIRSEAAGAGAALAVALTPSSPHTYQDVVPPAEARRFGSVAQCGADMGIAVIDLVPAFRARGRTDEGGRFELFYIHDKHWNAAGHELAARELARRLQELRLLPVGA